jgi:hypothetical protein
MDVNQVDDHQRTDHGQGSRKDLEEKVPIVPTGRHITVVVQ